MGRLDGMQDMSLLPRLELLYKKGELSDNERNAFLNGILREQMSIFSYEDLVNIGMEPLGKDNIKRFLYFVKKHKINEIIASSFNKARSLINQEHLHIRYFLLPLNPRIKFYTDFMDGMLAHTDSKNIIYIYLNTEIEIDFKKLESLCFHEFQHVLRNKYQNRGNVKLLDVVIDEGLSENFVGLYLGPDRIGRWANYQPLKKCLKDIDMFLNERNTNNPLKINEIMRGNTRNVPLWYGYSLGYYIVKDVTKKYNFIDLIKMDTDELFSKSYFKELVGNYNE